MNRSSIVKFIDLLSFVTLTLMVSTGVLVKYTLPPRSGGDAVWGLTRHDWGDVHYYLSLVFLVLIASHLVTHRNFIKAAIAGKASTESKYRMALGLLSVVALIALAFAPVASPVAEGQRGQHFQHQTD